MPPIKVKIPPPPPMINSNAILSPEIKIQMKTLWYVGRPNALSNFNWPKRQDLDDILAKNKKINLTGFKFKHDYSIQYF